MMGWMNSVDEALRNRKRGIASEDRFYRLLSFSPEKIPKWITLVTSASPRNDVDEGIDFYVITSDDETIPVDVKSSFVGKKNSLRENSSRKVCIIVIREELDDDSMRKQIIQILDRWHKTRLP